MVHIKKGICILLSVVIVLVCFGCNNAVEPETQDEHRPPYDQSVTEEYTDTDGQFDYSTVEWSGPVGYTIIIPSGNSAAKKTAELLRDYYKELGFSLNVANDGVPPVDKEILIGKTNRSNDFLRLFLKINMIS